MGNKLTKKDLSNLFDKMAKLAYENKDAKVFEGQKVKLNYSRIKSEKDYKKKRKSYKDFIEKNKNQIFTVEYDEYHQDGNLVCLKEDVTNPKWLFSKYDLIVLNKNLENIDTRTDIEKKIDTETQKLLQEVKENNL